jgi:hypothetical protein
MKSKVPSKRDVSVSNMNVSVSVKDQSIQQGQSNKDQSMMY